MIKPKSLEKRIGELTVDGNYLRMLHDNYGPNWIKKVAEDLNSVGDGVVHFKQPGSKDIGGLYPDVRSYVAAMAVKQGYRVKTNTYDASVLQRLWRGLITGNEKEGYRYSGPKYKFA
jgi:hypothetical protein